MMKLVLSLLDKSAISSTGNDTKVMPTEGSAKTVEMQDHNCCPCCYLQLNVVEMTVDTYVSGLEGV